MRYAMVVTSLVALWAIVVLNGCAPVGAAAGGAAVASVAPAIVGALGMGATLSDIAKAACATQDAANAAGKVADLSGSPVWSARFAEASKLAGIGCAW